ncbi:WxL domain-containing protein [Carnobacterium gallinarum]|uniref:WxL domain-containing protein n=1 Tax=Carnobacterium gallinarum TaxID=2749 RepID=UPI0005586E2D|nr:WxL domain-containing protein [Carnobacterium gallinarum]
MKISKVMLASAVLFSTSFVIAPQLVAAANPVGPDQKAAESNASGIFVSNTGPGGDLSPLRIESLTDISFGSHQQIEGDTKTYNSVYNDDNGAYKATNIVVNDTRGEQPGWKLFVQNTQFTAAGVTDEYKVLVGSELSFHDMVSSQTSLFPEITKVAPSFTTGGIVLNGDSIDTPIITATSGTGVGSWLNEFGVNPDATTNPTATTENDAIRLKILGNQKKKTNVAYVSQLTWSLADTPD